MQTVKVGNAGKTVECLSCRRRFKSLTRHLSSHNLTVEEYRRRYPGAALAIEGAAGGRPRKIEETLNKPAGDRPQHKHVAAELQAGIEAMADHDNCVAASPILSRSVQDWTENEPERRIPVRMDESLDDAIHAWMDIAKREIDNDENPSTKDGKARIYSFVLQSQAAPAAFLALNTSRTGKPLATVKAGSANREYLLATKLVWQKTREALGQDATKARNSYHRYAKAFCWAGNKGYTREMFRDALDVVGITAIEKEYDQHFGSGRDGPTERQKFKLARLKQFAEVGGLGASGVKAEPGQYVMLLSDDQGTVRRMALRVSKSKLEKIVSDGDVHPLHINDDSIGVLALPVQTLKWLRDRLRRDNEAGEEADYVLKQVCNTLHFLAPAVPGEADEQ